MNIHGTRFGVVDYSEQDVVLIESGLVGFPTSSRFVLINPRDDSPFRWLQSIDQPELAFLLADPTCYVRDYSPEISEEDAKDLDVTDATPILVFATASIPPGKPLEMTLDLAAPVLVNPATRRGAQVVLESPAYTMRYRVFDDTTPQDTAEAA